MSAEVAPADPAVVAQAPTAPALVVQAPVSAKTLLKGAKNTASGTNIEMQPVVDDAASVHVVSNAPIKLGTRYKLPFIFMQLSDF
jgi:hypothetical protein